VARGDIRHKRVGHIALRGGKFSHFINFEKLFYNNVLKEALPGIPQS
jgi:hypothetical protein